MKKFKISTVAAIAVYAMLAVVFQCCDINYNDNPHNIKYKVTLNSGLQQTHYFVLSEIEYLSNGCIKFKQFAYGKIDTAVVCGNFAVENYR